MIGQRLTTPTTPGKNVQGPVRDSGPAQRIATRNHTTNTAGGQSRRIDREGNPGMLFRTRRVDSGLDIADTPGGGFTFRGS